MAVASLSLSRHRELSILSLFLSRTRFPAVTINLLVQFPYCTIPPVCNCIVGRGGGSTNGTAFQNLLCVIPPGELKYVCTVMLDSKLPTNGTACQIFFCVIPPEELKYVCTVMLDSKLPTNATACQIFFCVILPDGLKYFCAVTVHSKVISLHIK